MGVAQHLGCQATPSIAWSQLCRPFQGLESWLHGVPVGCSVLYNMHREGSSSGPGRAWGGVFMAFAETSCPVRPGEEASRTLVFLFGALWYTICTMKVLRPWKGLGRSLHGMYSIYRNLLSRPWKGLERRLHGRAWRGGFMVFLFGALCYTVCTMKASQAMVLGNSHATHGSGLALVL